MSKTMFLFRSNLRILEGYHKYTNLEDFKLKCWDFYLLFPLWLLENDYFDEVVIWRLQPKKFQGDIIFNLPDGKKYIQRWIKSFQEIFKYSKPSLSFFRGGFSEYDHITKQNPEFFGTKLYLGAGKRVTPQYGGIYDKILVESEEELKNIKNSIPFYKTTNPNIFKPLNLDKIYDICWSCNFTQIRHKGQEFFISSISKSPFLKSLKIIHTGNKYEVGKELCKKYNVTNIEFVGWLDRYELNKTLNQSKVGIVTSNKEDGCPRISSEILMSGTPLNLRKQTRLLDYYKGGVVRFEDSKISKVVNMVLDNYNKYSKDVLKSIKDELSFEKICKKNMDLWTKNNC